MNSCWNGVNILLATSVVYYSYVALLDMVQELCTTVCAFDVRCESVT